MNDIEIKSGTTQKPVSSQRLEDVFRVARTSVQGVLYIGYPLISTSEGPYRIDGMLISPQKGVVAIDMVEGDKLPSDYAEKQDDLFNKIDSKLRSNSLLMSRRNLPVPLEVITYAPAVDISSINNINDNSIRNDSNIVQFIENLEDVNFNKYEELLSVIQSIAGIRKNTNRRKDFTPESRGAKLKHLEDSIANLDRQQSDAVIKSTDNVQRIRGLAGSGKTIVLALKAAYLHAQHPDWKIVVTFNTRSLKGQFKKLIEAFTIAQTGTLPDWQNLKIIQAWGSGENEKEGVYFNFCKANNVLYFNVSHARSQFGAENIFDAVCTKALDDAQEISSLYDAILIDEAQDFPLSFLKLCYNILGDKKRLVYAYDELQSLTDLSLPSPQEIFGKDKNGKPNVTLDNQNQDIILKRCYRNSRQILTTAHALGFGIYRQPDIKTQTGIIQLFENNMLWQDIGYSVDEGALSDNQRVKLMRTDASSPLFLENHSESEDLIQFISFANDEEQTNWLVDNIVKNLHDDELEYNDIIVINPNPLTTQKAIRPVRAKLFEKKIASHLAGVNTAPDEFFDQMNKSITFTGIHRAKGNEAGMVYIINAQDCYDSFGSLVTVRNRLFTAITRGKAWVRVLGVGDNMKKVEEEFEKVKQHDFTLDFTYPSEDVRKKLKSINRDMSDSEKRTARGADQSLKQLLEALNSGEITPEHLNSDLLNDLQKKLNDNGDE